MMLPGCMNQGDLHKMISQYCATINTSCVLGFCCFSIWYGERLCHFLKKNEFDLFPVRLIVK